MRHVLAVFAVVLLACSLGPAYVVADTPQSTVCAPNSAGIQAVCVNVVASGVTNRGQTGNQTIGVSSQVLDDASTNRAAPGSLYAVYGAARPLVDRGHIPEDDVVAGIFGFGCNGATCAKGTDIVYVFCDGQYGARVCAHTGVTIDANTDLGFQESGAHQIGLNMADGRYSMTAIMTPTGPMMQAVRASDGKVIFVVTTDANGTIYIGGGAGKAYEALTDDGEILLHAPRGIYGQSDDRGTTRLG